LAPTDGPMQLLLVDTEKQYRGSAAAEASFFVSGYSCMKACIGLC
jgi:hypothetical protein